MDQIELCNHLFFYSLEYKNNLRRIHYFNNDGVLAIQAPMSLRIKKVLELIKDNEEQVYKIMITTNTKKLVLSYGSKIKVLGQEYTIITYNRNLIKDNYICLKELTIIQLTKVLKPVLEEYIKVSQHYYFSLMYSNKIEPDIKFRNVKTYFGQYNSRSNYITYNIGLALMSKELVDYVIVHELSHMTSMNHDKKFYRQMASYDKDYRKHKNRLRKEWIKLC